MEATDYPIEHFGLMAEVAKDLKAANLQLLEHSYADRAFGSWWFTFDRAGRTYRMVFDGKECDLRVELGHPDSSNRWCIGWSVIASMKFGTRVKTDALREAVQDLLQRTE